MPAVIAARAPAWRAWRPAAAPAPRRQRLAVRPAASLLDLLKGGGGSEGTKLEPDSMGEELKAWAQERGLQAPQLAAAAVPGAGRGLVATAAISKGEPLLRLPSPLLITADAALQRSALRGLLEERRQPLPAWSVLALWLAEARAAGERDALWPYLRLLPRRTGCVLEWSEEEVGWLAGSQLGEAAAEIRGAAEASWEEMQPLLAAAAQLGLGPPGAFSREALQWAFSMLLSRLVRLPGLGPPPGTEALLPFADLLNHSPGCASFLDWSPEEGAVVLAADRRYRAGEEVHVSYGPKTSGELLLSYGFCPEPGANPHDGCKLRLALAPGDPALAAKAAALERRGFAPSQLFPLKMAAAPWELMHYAALSVAELGGGAGAGAGVEAEAEALARRLFDEDDMPPELQPAALEAVVRACQAAQRAYPSSLDADRAELETLQNRAAGTAAAAAARAAGGQPQAAGAEEGERERRRRWVLQCLVYERQVLARTLFVLQQELKDLRRMGKAKGQ